MIDEKLIYAELKDLKRMLREFKASKLEEYKPILISSKEVCDLLNISKKTLSNYVSDGTISPSMISIGIGGNKFFDKEKIIGLKK